MPLQRRCPPRRPVFHNGHAAVDQQKMFIVIEELRRQIEALTERVVQNQVLSHDGVGSEEEDTIIIRGLFTFHKNASNRPVHFSFDDRRWDNVFKVDIHDFLEI